MKKLTFILLLLACSLSGFGQDTVLVYNNYKYKIGLKFTSDKSGDLSVSPNVYQVYGGGIQIIKKIKKSHFGLTLGLFYCNRRSALRIGYNSYHTINLPLGIRYENKIFYIVAEGYLNCLLKTEKVHLIQKNIIQKNRVLNIGYILAIGIEKDISKRLNLFVEVHDMSNLTSTQIEENTLGLTYLVNYGFSLGLNYKIF